MPIQLEMPSKDKITIYTTSYCPYCIYAKDFLQKNSLPFKEIDVTNAPLLREALVKITKGRTTVPQIFIGEESIGGYDNLIELSKSGNFELFLEKAGIRFKSPLYLKQNPL